MFPLALSVAFKRDVATPGPEKAVDAETDCLVNCDVDVSARVFEKA